MRTDTAPAAKADSTAASAKATTRGRRSVVPPVAPPLATGRLSELPVEDAYGRAIREATARIEEWLPKGVHFGWELAFRNKGKFPAWMSKGGARTLVATLLRGASLQIYPNRRDGVPDADQLRVVADADSVVGTRGQRRVRIVLVADEAGWRVDNAFPVRER